MRRARIDTSHPEIVAALRACGWLVKSTAALPNWIDAIACKPGRVVLLEFKTGKGKLRPSQDRLIEKGWPIQILRTAADAARL